MAAEPVGTEAEALRRLCWEKCHGMELGNHLTGFNALQNIGEPHVEMLKRMGYSYTSPRLHDLIEGREVTAKAEGSFEIEVGPWEVGVFYSEE